MCSEFLHRGYLRWKMVLGWACPKGYSECSAYFLAFPWGIVPLAWNSLQGNPVGIYPINKSSPLEVSGPKYSVNLNGIMSDLPISVLIADDHSVVRDGLRTMLLAVDDMRIVAEACTGKEAVELTHQHRPSVIIMDLAMPELNGFEAMRQILDRQPDCKFLVLSAYCELEHIRRCLEIGAQAFLSKENSFTMLCQAIRAVAQGQRFFCPLTRKLLATTETGTNGNGSKAKSNGSRSSTLGLTERELQVLKLVSEGEANKQIAAHLGISIKTVEKHRQQLMNKLDIHDTAGLTRFAIATGVIENELLPPGNLD